jgi:hypothetical protein
LTVTSGGLANVVAVINFSGHYVTSNFHITSGSSGTVEIFDPPLAKQQLDFSVPPLLGYLENAVDTSWMIADDALTGKFTLLCNYIASEFASVVDGHGAVALNEMAHLTDQQLQPLLTRPHP